MNFKMLEALNFLSNFSGAKESIMKLYDIGKKNPAKLYEIINYINERYNEKR
jgi:hypothetical protein